MGQRNYRPPDYSINHFFFQKLTRAVAAAQDAGLFDWLTTLYPMWARMDAGAIRVSTAVAIAELMLSGCTTASDHGYGKTGLPLSRLARLDVDRAEQGRAAAGFRG